MKKDKSKWNQMMENSLFSNIEDLMTSLSIIFFKIAKSLIDLFMVLWNMIGTEDEKKPKKTKNLNSNNFGKCIVCSKSIPKNHTLCKYHYREIKNTKK